MKRRDELLSSSLDTIAVTSVVTILYPSPNGSDHKEAKGYIFTFAYITDSQFSESSAIFEDATSWLAQQNISFIIHTGEIVSSLFDDTT